jgi:hypothetical protein
VTPGKKKPAKAAGFNVAYLLIRLSKNSAL